MALPLGSPVAWSASDPATGTQQTVLAGTTHNPAATVGAYPGTFVVGTSTGAAQANSPTLPAVAGKINYCAGFTVTGGGATGASAVTITLSDGTKTLNFMTEIPAGAGLQITPLVVNFNPPLPASAANTAWTLTVPSFGSGNTAASSNLWGYVQ